MVRSSRPSPRSGQRYEKVTITLPSELLEAARAGAGPGRTRSLSAFIAEAIEAKLQTDELQDVLHEIFAEHPMTADERAWADQYLLGH